MFHIVYMRRGIFMHDVELRRRFVAEIARDAEEIEFSEEVRVGSVEAVRGAFVKVEKWTG
jgi:hypothetical protein